MSSVTRLSAAFLLVLCVAVSAVAEPLRFNRDIRPILSDKCFACHGPAAHEGDTELRLDLRESAVAEWESIVPGEPDESEMVRRMLSQDESELMPPPEAHKPLTPEEIELLKRWIAEGAEYESHWAYTPLERPEPPATKSQAIDGFIDRGLEEAGLAAMPEADRVTLIRRLSFDLTGMPPTTAEVEAFVNDKSPDAYEKLVDRLLASPRYGERMAIYWLDLVRYADTVGYHGDQDVSQSPYRDYVIAAFNSNMPYDQFIREQLAGDLLPNATLAQKVASGYNRLNQTTEEGGSQAKEYLAIYFADRVRNVSQVFMGATVGCAQCHDHKYDPYTMKDFYSLGAFFADLNERGVYSARSRPPQIPVPSMEQQAQLADLERQIDQAKVDEQQLRETLLKAQEEWEKEIVGSFDEQVAADTVWIDDNQGTGRVVEGAWDFVTEDKGPVHSLVKSRRQQAEGLVQHYFLNAEQVAKVSQGTKFYAWVRLDPKNQPQAIMLQLNDGSWDHRAVWGSDAISFGKRAKNWAGYYRQGKLPEAGEWVRLEVDAQQLGLKPGSTVQGMAFTQYGGLAYWDQAGWAEDSGVPQEVVAGLKVPATERTAPQATAVSEYYLSQAEPMKESKAKIASLEQEKKNLEKSFVTMVVSQAVKPRTIRILNRGNWMDDSGEIVEPAIPEFLGALDTGDQRATRLDLANWLGEPDNVLTSRTMANRLWYLMFGRGLSTSVDDFGGQGVYPTHPELLDWLAVEFVESGWDIKHLLRTIVNTDAYRRSSVTGDHLKDTDADNRLLARQGRFPLPAEMVRDNALYVSGLLVEEVGGRSVKPYQPGGYYAQLNFPRRKYVADKGESQYRRGVYTHWQRTFLHPMMKAFDAPSREECTAARSRSNTPLMALTLLNDPTFVEAARVLAVRIMTEGGDSPAERIAWAYHSAVSRDPEPEIVGVLTRLFEQHLAYYKQHPEDATKLLSVGDAPQASDLDQPELAAWTSVARTLLNLNETIFRY